MSEPVKVWIARDESGDVTIRTEKPTLEHGLWRGGIDVSLLASLFPIRLAPGECRAFLLVEAEGE